MWIAGNIPNKVDVEWLKRGGGIVGHDHPPAYRFNAGQKMIYWIVVIGGTAVAITGYLLMFPFYATGIEGMQLAQTVHAIVARAVRRRDARRTSISAPSAWKAPSRRWARARSTSTGRRSITRSGSSRKWRAPVRMRSQRQPMATPAE